MRRLLTVPFLFVFLVAWALSPSGTLPVSAAIPPQVIPTADILRGPYEAPALPVVPIADVLRGPVEAPMQAVVVPRADVLRGAYEAPAVAYMPTADVLRGPYTPFAVAPIAVSRADVLRGAYAPPAHIEATVPLADVLRNVEPAAMPVLVRGEQPLADVLRGPYEAVVPAVVTQPTRTLALIVGSIAAALLLLALALDASRRMRGAKMLPSGGNRPLEHPH